MNKAGYASAKYPLLSLASIVLCGIIGSGWAWLMIRLSSPLWSFFEEAAGKSGDYILGYVIPILFLLTFAAVSVIYCFAEKLGAKCGFTRGKFFLWFAVIPFAITLIMPAALNFGITVMPAYIISVLEKTAYFLIIIFCTLRYIFGKIYLALNSALKKGELNGNNS